MARMPEFKAFEALRDLLSGGDPRLTLPTPERVNRQTVARAQAWLERLCKSAPIEVAVVGDMKLEEALPLIEKYIGSLAPRPRTPTQLDGLRKLNRKPGPLEAHVAVDTETPKAVVMYGFVAADTKAIDEVRQLRMVSNVLDSRLIKRIREELGLVYGIQVMNQPGVAYTDSGMFVAMAPCDPAKAEEVAKEAETIFRAMAEAGPTAEELENARKQVLNSLDTTMKEPSYWWGILQNHDLHQVNLEKLKTIKEDYQGYTADQLKAVFAKYYTPARTVRVISAPAAGSSGTKPEKAGEKQEAAPKEQ
jgi:zinc protease